MLKKIIQYFKDSYMELSKVTWPTKNQAIKLTGIVLGCCLVTAVFLGGIDAVFSTLYNLFLKTQGIIY